LYARDRFKIKKLEDYSLARNDYSHRIESTIDLSKTIEEKNRELELKEAQYIKELN
jgi:hypothetical protein